MAGVVVSGDGGPGPLRSPGPPDVTAGWHNVTTAAGGHPPWRTVTAATATRGGRHAGGADPLPCPTPPTPWTPLPPCCPASGPVPFRGGGAQGARTERPSTGGAGRHLEGPASTPERSGGNRTQRSHCRTSPD